MIWPESTGEVSTILRTCNELRVPVIAFGAGTSLEGHVSAPRGGICIDMSRMDQVLAVHAEDADCVVQPGVTREALNTYLRDTGLFFPVDPGANATLGGMISTRASGTTTVRYGTIAHNVLALEVVLANGDDRSLRQSRAQILRRLRPGALVHRRGGHARHHHRSDAAPARAARSGRQRVSARSAELRGAVEAVIELIQSGAPLARIEFLDEVQVRACNAYSKLSLPEQPTLFIEFHGTAGERRRAVRARGGDRALARRHRTSIGRRTSSAAASSGARGTLRTSPRWACAPAANASSPTSACRSPRLAECVAAARARDRRRRADRADRRPRRRRQFSRAVPARARRCRRARAHGARLRRDDRACASSRTAPARASTASAWVSATSWSRSSGSRSSTLMRRLKEAWDPHDILNPGKVFHD